MTNYFLENPDLLTTFDRVVRWDEIVPLSEGKDADVADTVSTWREVLSVAGEYIGTEVAKRARQVDEIGVIREGGKVYAHCAGGRHRGVAMGACILVAQGHSPLEAMQLIKERRSFADPHIYYIRSQILRFALEWENIGAGLPHPT